MMRDGRGQHGGGKHTRSQLGVTSHITQSIDTVDTGVLIFVDFDMAGLVQLNAGDIEVQVLNLGQATHGPEELVDLHFRSVVRDKLEQLVLALTITDELHLLETRVLLVDVDARGLVPLSHGLLNHGVELAQESLATDEHVRLASNGAHHTGQLHCNVSRTDNGNLGRQFLDLKEAIASDTVLGALDVRDAGPSTHRNQDVGGRVPCFGAILESHLDGLGLDETGAAVDQINALATPVAFVDSIQPLDGGVANFLEVAVVLVDVLGDVVAVVLGDVESLVDGGEVPGHLLGDTAAGIILR